MARNPTQGKWSKLYYKIKSLRKMLVDTSVSLEMVLTTAKEAAEIARSHCDSSDRLAALGNTIGYSVEKDVIEELSNHGVWSGDAEATRRMEVDASARVIEKIVVRENGVLHKRRKKPVGRKRLVVVPETLKVLEVFSQLMKIQHKYHGRKHY